MIFVTIFCFVNFDEVKYEYSIWSLNWKSKSKYPLIFLILRNHEVRTIMPKESF